MKKVLITDSHPLFREFLKQRLVENQIDVILSQENRDSYTRMLNSLPNLVILDMEEDNIEEMELLEKKAEDSNTAGIPVIVLGPTQDKANVAALAKFGVVKYFAKPIQFDIFFESIGKILKTPLSIDTTPCVLDIHRNGNIFFIELAQGLNREKIALLQFKLTELIEKEEIENPKIIVMLTNLDLSFVDGYNLEFLIDNIIACNKVHNKNVKILSLSNYVKELLEGHIQYKDIELSSNLSTLLNELVDTSITSSVSDLITEKILSSSASFQSDESSIATKFSADESDEKRSTKDDGTLLKVAVIDSNKVDMLQTRDAFEAIGAEVSCFTSGNDFTKAYENGKFNIIILDVYLEDKTGLSLLQFINRRLNPPKTIVYSPNLNKELISKVLSSGANSCILKPQKPNVLTQKCLSLLQTTF